MCDWGRQGVSAKNVIKRLDELDERILRISSDREQRQAKTIRYWRWDLVSALLAVVLLPLFPHTFAAVPMVVVAIFLAFRAGYSLNEVRHRNGERTDRFPLR